VPENPAYNPNHKPDSVLTLFDRLVWKNFHKFYFKIEFQNVISNVKGA